MVRRRCPFGQLLQLIPRTFFEAVVSESGADRHCKGFTSWSHHASMLFGQLEQMDSLRQISEGMAPHSNYLKFMGIQRLPKKSNLARANERRDHRIFEKLLWKLLEVCRSRIAMNLRPSKFRFSRKLFSLDASIVRLCRTFYKWAAYGKTGTKCGVKIHMLLNHEDLLPAVTQITEASIADITAADDLKLPQGSIVAMDRGYNDYAFFRKLTGNDIRFVTRLKQKAKYRVLECRPTPVGRYIKEDKVIIFDKDEREQDDPQRLRRITAWIEEQKRDFVFLTNDLTLSSATIADIYKERWKIESFFKDLKQNLKIRHFLGTSENAVKIQIWTALIALTLVRFMKHLSRKGHGLTVTASLLRSILFSDSDLLETFGISKSLWAKARAG